MRQLRAIDAGADVATGRLTFARDTGFHDEVKRRVLAYFERTGLSQQDSPRMHLKTAVLLLWFGASYALLVFAATSVWQGALLSASLALAMAGIGFGIQHDANHGAYSSRAAVNRVMAMTLDMLGASSYLWRVQHNLSHHTYTNIEGADDDINFVPFARLSPGQPRYRLHHLQQFYLWALYWFLFPKWNFVDDFKNVTRGRIGGRRFPRPRGRHLIELVGGKMLFFGWAFAIPLLVHSWWVVLLFYATTALVLGTTLAVVFMLAHCVEEADFVSPNDLASKPRLWAVHEVETTVNFCPRNRVLTWLVGGLNYQIEHHLFPRVPHTHYPRIAEIVQRNAELHGVRYVAQHSLAAALRSHFRHLRTMGRMGVPIALEMG